jgi:hypothetical protein
MRDYTTAIGDAGSRRIDYCSLKLSFEFGRQKPDGWLSRCLAIETEKEKRGRRSPCGFIVR